MRPQPQLTINTMPVDELVPYIRNAKKHPQKQVDEIAASIEAFGNCDPIAVWHNADGAAEIVEGHGRVLALKKLGIKEAPVIFLDHLTDEQRRAYTHAHNQTTLSSGFDWDTLTADIAELDFEWADFGFDVFDMAEAATASNDFEPRNEEIKTYSEQGSNELKSYNVVVCCLDDDEQEFMRNLFAEEGRLKRLYMASELMERIDA